MKKLFIATALMGALVLSVTISIIFFHYNDTAQKRADCIVVFGAAVWEDNTPSHALYDRITTAIDLYNRKMSNDCIILSGGESAQGIAHEVDVMRAFAVDAGIPLHTIYTDYIGTDTRSTVTHLTQEKSYILVSNDFHLARIKLFARRYNLSFQTHAATYRYGRYRKEIYFVFREVIALWYYTFIK